MISVASDPFADVIILVARNAADHEAAHVVEEEMVQLYRDPHHRQDKIRQHPLEMRVSIGPHERTQHRLTTFLTYFFGRDCFG